METFSLFSAKWYFTNIFFIIPGLDHLKVHVKAKLLAHHDVPGAAKPGVQLPLQVVWDLRGVPVEPLHGRHDDLQHLLPHVSLHRRLDGHWPGRQTGETVWVYKFTVEVCTEK